MALVSVKDISKRFGSEPLFTDFSFSIDENAGIGLIGPNGAGKSTLLKILVGMEDLDDGTLSRKRGLKTLWIDQDSSVPENVSAREFLFKHAVASGLSADEATGLIASALGKSNITDPEVLASSLSGGQKKRLHLSRMFLERPDLVFLDEPTNHLDLEGIIWLEGILREANFAWVLTSHDRYFLDRTAKTIVELSGVFPGYYFQTNGGYSTHIEKRGLWLEAQKSESQSLANKVRRENEWLLKGPKARTTKQQARIDEAMRLGAELSELKGRLNRTQQSDIEFSASGRKTKKLVELINLKVSRGERALINGMSYTISARSRTGIIGKNGSGKSSLLKTISRELEPSGGEIKYAQDLAVVYFDQHREALDPTWTLKRALGDGGDAVVFQGRSLHIVSWARRFQFDNDQLDTPVAQLSGGERARLLVARLMLKSADVLILDEPTNDLDIDTLEVLEASLLEFPGAIIMVSHDRHLLTKVCTHFLGIDGQGGYSAVASYEQWEKEIFKGRGGAREIAAPSGKSERKQKKLSFKEQFELEETEGLIAKTEERILILERRLEQSSGKGDAGQTASLYAELTAERNILERTYMRWADLEEKKSNLDL